MGPHERYRARVWFDERGCMHTRSNVLEHDAVVPERAVAHFAAKLAYETDCSDLAGDIAAGIDGFVVIDCRSPELYDAGHVPGAVNIPHRRIDAAALARVAPAGTELLITYCNGPHCNASTRGALHIASLGRAVKEMPGGMDGWLREGLPVEGALVPPDTHVVGPADHT